MRPTPLALLLFLLGFPLAVLPVLYAPAWWAGWLAYVGAALTALGLDAMLALAPRGLGAGVEAPAGLQIANPGTLTVTLRAARSCRAELRVELGPRLAPVAPEQVPLVAGRPARVPVALVPRSRGGARIERIWLRWRGPLGLVERKKCMDVGQTVAVEPNVNAVRSAAIRLYGPREFATGLKVERYVGEGTEFDSLREYVPGLDARAIDWRATARHRKLICQDYRAERNHPVILAVDTGHLMSEPLDGVPKLDHAITAALVLAYTGLRTGDRVGFFAFDSMVRAYAEPQGGVRAFPRLRRLTADLDYSDAETNFTLGLAELGARLRRRSLVVLLTDFVDTVTAELMLDNVQHLARRHLVVFVTLRDPELQGVAAQEPTRLSELYAAVVAGDFVREREIVLARLRQRGVHCLDAPPKQVTSALLNHYLERKRRELVG